MRQQAADLPDHHPLADLLPDVHQVLQQFAVPDHPVVHQEYPDHPEGPAAAAELHHQEAGRLQEITDDP